LRDGHYTKADITELNVYKEPGRVQVAVATLKNGAKILSNGFDIEITENPKAFSEKQVYTNYKKCKVPDLYATVAEIVYKKAYGHGGYRPGAGRKKDESKAERSPRTFRLTGIEYQKVKTFIEEMRKEGKESEEES